DTELLHHPQLEHDRRITTIDDPEVGPVLQAGALVRMDATPAALDRPAPRLDEHAADVRSVLALPGRPMSDCTTPKQERVGEPPAGGLRRGAATPRPRDGRREAVLDAHELRGDGTDERRPALRGERRHRARARVAGAPARRAGAVDGDVDVVDYVARALGGDG